MFPVKFLLEHMNDKFVIFKSLPRKVSRLFSHDNVLTRSVLRWARAGVVFCTGLGKQKWYYFFRRLENIKKDWKDMKIMAR